MTTICTSTRDGRTDRWIEGGTPAQAIGRFLRIHRRNLDHIESTDNTLGLIIHWPTGDETREYKERT